MNPVCLGDQIAFGLKRRFQKNQIAISSNLISKLLKLRKLLFSIYDPLNRLKKGGIMAKIGGHIEKKQFEQFGFKLLTQIGLAQFDFKKSWKKNLSTSNIPK